ncbi:hypothetical protein SEUCBS139899_006070 [Sporothrix eucalyptigena]|uniref:Secretory lipase n=1 Tax=Sporothrix eucalyptigena TaxID=1812306 RepID=A0ABP0CQ29_9PEZI
MWFHTAAHTALTLSVLSAVTLAAPVEEVKRATPPLPSADSFYSVPENIASYAPGAIINHRSPPSSIAAFGIDPVNLEATYQISYRTTDNLGNATSTVLTVMVPENADMTKVLSYQVAEDAASLDCAPSYAMQLADATGPLLGTIVTQAEILLIVAALYQGWVVIMPDHEGPQGAYLANRLAGYATLDGIRAALQSTSITGIQSDARVGMWGYSGGSLASMWAAALQPSYAPELASQLVGAAVGGTVPNIHNVINTVNEGPFAGLIAAGIMGLSHVYPLIAEVVKTQFSNQDKFEAVLHQCLVPDIADFLLADVKGMAANQSLWTEPAITEILDYNSLESFSAPSSNFPFYLYKSVLDEASPIADTDALVDAYCSAGVSIEYTRDLVSEHGSLAVIGAPKALVWLKDRMNGQAASSGCSTNTVISSLLDIATIEVLPTFLLDALSALLGGEVGPTFFG